MYLVEARKGRECRTAVRESMKEDVREHALKDEISFA